MARKKISYSKHTGSLNQLLNQLDNILVLRLDQRSPLVQGMLNMDLELLVLDLDLPLPLLLSLLLTTGFGEATADATRYGYGSGYGTI